MNNNSYMANYDSQNYINHVYQYPFLGSIENLISKKIKYTRKKLTIKQKNIICLLRYTNPTKYYNLVKQKY